MAKFISIPVTNKGTTIIPTDGLVTTYVSATSVILAAGGRILTFVTVGATTAFTDAINTAAMALNGPTVVPVTLPAAQTITSIAIS